jgi:hypothetical protein
LMELLLFKIIMILWLAHNIYNTVNEQDSLSEPLLKCTKAAEALSAWSLRQLSL